MDGAQRRSVMSPSFGLFMQWESPEETTVRMIQVLDDWRASFAAQLYKLFCPIAPAINAVR